MALAIFYYCIEHSTQNCILFLGPRSLLAHPHYGEAGYVYNVSTNWLRSRYEIFRIPPNANATDPFSGATIMAIVHSSFSSPAYFHSFGMSENFFILIQNPLVMKSLWKMLTMNFLETHFNHRVPDSL